MNMSLYELDKTIKEVLEQGFTFDLETGEVTFTTDDLEKLETSRDEKINNIVGFIKNLEIEAKNYKQISDDYKNRAESKMKKSEKLRQYLDSFMTANNLEKKEVLNGIVSYKKSTSTDIYDEDKLRKYIELHQEIKDKYTTTKIEFSKKEIGNDLKNGIEIDGVCLKENKNLQVK